MYIFIVLHVVYILHTHSMIHICSLSLGLYPLLLLMLVLLLLWLSKTSWRMMMISSIEFSCRCFSLTLIYTHTAYTLSFSPFHVIYTAYRHSFFILLDFSTEKQSKLWALTARTCTRTLWKTFKECNNVMHCIGIRYVHSFFLALSLSISEWTLTVDYAVLYLLCVCTWVWVT